MIDPRVFFTAWVGGLDEAIKGLEADTARVESEWK